MNLNKLIPAIFSAADEHNVDVGVGASMVLNNIRHGYEKDSVGDLPTDHKPDFSALHDESTAMGDKFDEAWGAFNVKRQRMYDTLVPLWRSFDFDGMVKAMEDAE